MKRLKKIFLFVNVLFIMLTISDCSSKKTLFKNTNVYTYEKVKIGEELLDTQKKSLIIKRYDKNAVFLSFREEFDDTLTMYINNHKIKRWSMFNDSNKTPGYKPFDTLLFLKKKLM